MAFKRSMLCACVVWLAAGAAQADGIWDRVGNSWACECLTFDGGTEACHMFASGRDGAFSFGAFETSGEGTYSVEDGTNEIVVTGQIQTVTGQDMTVIIVQQKAGGPAEVFVGDRSSDDAAFTAACAND